MLFVRFSAFRAMPALCAALACLALSGAAYAAESPQTNGAGDIPDSQVFVRYTSPDGYSLLVPEGWSRTEGRSTVTFVSHYDGVRVVLERTGDPVAIVRRRFPGASDVRVRRATIAGMPATVVTFSSQSAPDPVTGKSVRLENAAYAFSKGGRLALVVMWAPQGADNADQWNKIAQSFRWR